MSSQTFPTGDQLVKKALAFATEAHSGQVRKVTGEPYIVHPIEVAKIVADVPDATQEMVAAAFLHDVIEDTPISEFHLRQEFPDRVVDLVVEMTTPGKRTGETRRDRHHQELTRLTKISAAAHTIKVADIISNVSTIVEVDPEFAKVYLPEKKAQLRVLMKAPHQLLIQADHVIHGETNRLGLLQARPVQHA